MRLKKRFIIISIISTLLLISLAFFFQNCGNVSIERKIIEASQAMSIENNFCAFDAAVQTSPININFVVDMSASNLGIINTTTPPLTTFCNFLTSSDQSNPNFPPSDSSTQRIDEMIQFIRNCGRSSFINYSVSGFSSDSFFATNAESCTSQYVSDTQALNALEKLKLIQNSYVGQELCHRDSFNYMESNTSYKAALSCLKTKISSDLNLNLNLKPSYFSILVTDGAPFEPDVQVADGDYLNLVDDIKSEVASLGGSFILNPVYYGVDPNEKDRALTLLDKLAKRSDPNAQVQFVTQFANLASQWCKALETKKYEFTLAHSLAVNINAINNKGILQADSDADGVSDLDEEKYGFDKKNPRTFGILDSLCLRSGMNPQSNCRSLFSPSQEVFITPGLTNHDLEASAKIFGQTLTGLDTDSDGIPDYIEIIRGLNPVVKDADLDPDLDGMTNRVEISLGLDPFNNNQTYKTEGQKTLQLLVQKNNSSSCTGDKTAFKYNLDSVTKTTTLGFTDASSLNIQFSGAAGDNQVLIYTFWKNEANSSVPGILYLQSVKISDQQIQTSDNYKLGEVKP